MMTSISIFGLAYMQLGPAYGREVLDLNAGMTGLFMMAAGIGSIIGSSIMVAFDIKNRTAMFVAFAGLFAVALLGLAITPWSAAAFLLMGIFGVSSSGLVILGQTIFQNHGARSVTGQSHEPLELYGRPQRDLGPAARFRQ